MVTKIDENTIQITQDFPFKIGEVNLFLWATFHLDSTTYKLKKTRFEFFREDHHTPITIPYKAWNFNRLQAWALKDAMNQLVFVDTKNLKGAN